ncbi:MAG: hypothetical protein GY913_21255 [Proteobacteria bacterium]|nr:hypothetical protein [Pseudomonadota bacterium]
MSVFGPIVALLLAIVGIILARRGGDRRTVRIAVPLLAVPISALEAFLIGRDALMDLPALEPQARFELAAHAHSVIPATESLGLTCAAVAVLAVAWAEAWQGELVDARAGGITALAAFLGAGLVGVVTSAQGGEGTLALHPTLFVVLGGLACAISVAYRGADAKEAVARALSVSLLVLALGVLLVFIQDDLWLLYGTPELHWNSGKVAAVVLTLLATAPLLKHRFWDEPDHFGVELTVGLATAGAAMMLRMPVMFLMDRLLQATPGGQVIAIEKRLLATPTVQQDPGEVDVLSGWMYDTTGWFGTTDGVPVELPLEGDRLPVAMKRMAAATLFTDQPYSEHEVTLALWVQHTEPDHGHPLAQADRYGLFEFTWMPTVPATWSPSSPILVPEEGWALQDLVTACVEHRAQWHECRITPAQP